MPIHPLSPLGMALTALQNAKYPQGGVYQVPGAKPMPGQMNPNQRLPFRQPLRRIAKSNLRTSGTKKTPKPNKTSE